MLTVNPAGAAPHLHVRERDGRQVLVVEGAAAGWTPAGWPLLLTAAGQEAVWMVMGRLPVEELERVLLSLPSQPS
jgi:hypothetical protein